MVGSEFVRCNIKLLYGVCLRVAIGGMRGVGSPRRGISAIIVGFSTTNRGARGAD